MNKLLHSLSPLPLSPTLLTPNLNPQPTTNTQPQLKPLNHILIQKPQQYNLLKPITPYHKQHPHLTHKIKI
ncbi:DUF5011 domain-containing protein, partial [Staphylococcus epidermidis]|uniref:DUF5011 domain-containing protein n=1 Tax=Staphylococcus epidermidis TaxID=1282 RepID=UPI0021B3D586